jgi:hypothetical protein
VKQAEVMKPLSLLGNMLHLRNPGGLAPFFAS